MVAILAALPGLPSERSRSGASAGRLLRSLAARSAVIGTGRLLGLRPRPLRLAGIKSRGAPLSACRSATVRRAICESRAPVSAATQMYGPNAGSTAWRRDQAWTWSSASRGDCG